MKQEATLADKMGSKQTEYLYNRIKEIAKVGYAFGHQDDTAYGMGWKNDIGLLEKIAIDKNKPYALSEAGLNEIPIANWWTEVLDRNIAKSGISWALFGEMPGQTITTHHILDRPAHQILFCIKIYHMAYF